MMDSRADSPPDRRAELPEPASPPPSRGGPVELGGGALEPVAPPEPGWSGSDALAEFPTESEAEEAARRRKAVGDGRVASAPLISARSTAARLRSLWPAAAAVLVLVLIGAAAWRWWPARGPAVETGSVAIETTPAGASVAIDGKEFGKTPVSIALPAGTHALVVTGASGRRELPITVVPRTQVVHHIELAQAAAPRTGRLEISARPGASIVLDGVPRGVAPAVLTDVPPGDHSVTVGEGAAAVTRRVSVPAGGLASLLLAAEVPAGRAAPAWVSIVSPIELQVFDGEVLIGSSTAERILVLAGRHTINLVNNELGYRAPPRAVTVEAGRVATVRVDVPNGVLHVNAMPWAEVFIDGKRAGETPLANLAVPIGSHQVTFRNPKFPEQRRSVVISLAGPTRVGVDLRQ